MGIYNLYFMDYPNHSPRLLAAECTEREAMAEMGKFLEEIHQDGFGLNNVSVSNTLIYEIAGTKQQFVIAKVSDVS